jgi:hypothetical protein
MNVKVLISLAIVVAAIVGAAMWFLRTTPPPQVADALNATPAPTLTDDMMWGGKRSPRVAPDRSTPAPKAPEKSAARPSTPAAPPADWEIKIQQAIEANPDNSDAANLATAQTLINMLPTFPPDGQVEAAQHLLNLLPDAEYGRVLPIVKNPTMPEEVLDVFVTELMNREDPVKLPALLEIAKIPNHPHQEEALTDLQIFLDDDFGTNWNRWDVALKDYLKKQADETAAEATTPSALVPAPR